MSRKRTRECGAGCGSPLRRGHARTAHVLSTTGALVRTFVCPLCARRGVLTVAHLDEPLRAPAPPRVKPRTVSAWFAEQDREARATPTLPSVGVMSRDELEAEAVRLGTDGSPLVDEVLAQRARASTREALEARVSVLRARAASSPGTVPAAGSS